VELGGVDVVDAELHRAAQAGDRGVAVGVQAFQLHRAVSDAGNRAAADRPGPSGARGAGGVS